MPAITAETLANLDKSDLIALVAAALSDEVTQTTAEPTKPTRKEEAEALVEKGGYSFAKGRLYVNDNLIETVARVKNTKKPQVVSGSGGRYSLVYVADESQDVVIQNLYKKGDK